MKKNDMTNKKMPAIEQMSTDIESKKKAWEIYKTKLRIANSGYSEIDLT